MKTDNNDPLEEFIRSNKEDYPQAEPSNDLWSKIDQRLDEQDTPQLPLEKKDKVIQFKVKTLWRVAAFLVLGFGFGFLAAKYTGSTPVQDQDPIALQEDDTVPEVVNNYYVSLSDLSPDLEGVEEYYQGEIESRVKELDKYGANAVGFEEMTELQSEYMVLQNEAISNQNNPRVIEAMVNNYKLRLQVLETLLEAMRIEQETETLPSNTSDDVSM